MIARIHRVSIQDIQNLKYAMQLGLFAIFLHTVISKTLFTWEPDNNKILL